MKIAIDATDSFWPYATGTVVYVREVVKHLAPLASGCELTLLGLRTKGADTSFAPAAAWRLLGSPRSRAVWTQLRLPIHLLRHRYDMLHMPSPKLPFLCPCASIVTVHDLAFFKHPEHFQAEQRKRLALYADHALRHAHRLIADSHATKRDVIERYGRKDHEVEVIHLGVDLNRFHPGVPPAQRGSPYILSVGTLQPRKNYVMLVRAFKQLCASWRDPIDLVIAGQRGWLWEPIAQEASRGPYARRIHFLEYVPEADLPGLYAGATVFAMPSLYEGFGIPLLEAMACGVPVVASNTSSLPEVVGDAGILLGPHEVDGWAVALARLLGDAAQRAALREKGIARSREFSWARTARRTLEAYEKTVTK